VLAQARAEEHDRRGGKEDDGEPRDHAGIVGHSRIAKTWPIQPPTSNVPERSKPWRSYQATSGGFVEQRQHEPGVVGAAPADTDGRHAGARYRPAPPVTPALEVRNLAKRYGATAALRGVDLTVGEAELVGLLGPNGAGKSTLVKSAAGLVRPSAGTVRVCGAAAGTPPARRALGYLAELFRFPGWASADELLRLHQRLSGSTGGPTERAELLGLVGLGDEGGRRVEAMSKGMQQRLGIAQALVGGPRLLLLDEPTSALDPVGRRIVRDLLGELRRRGVAVLLNTHLLSEVERVCDRVAIIDHGELMAEGRPDELSRPHGVEVETAAGTQRFEGATRDEVPAIVERLVAAGERIYEVRLVRSTLEDAYLAVVEPDRPPPPAPLPGAVPPGGRTPWA
jgi:ABC-2 type transport system ATP-binding protein